MSDSYSTKRNLPFLTEFSPKDAQLAQRTASDYEERQRMAQDAHAQKARNILALTVAALMAVMVAATAGPAFAGAKLGTGVDIET